MSYEATESWLKAIVASLDGFSGYYGANRKLAVLTTENFTFDLDPFKNTALSERILQ